MKYLSVCSGIEAATVAWHDLGWQPVGFSEIEPFPSQVLAHHYPDVQNYGDMTNFKEWNCGETNLLVGGTPCQSFSVAGLRAGLDDPRGNLALVYCSMLDHFRPTWFVWENVPGVLSSNKGRDFGSFLGAVAELGYGFAYRVLDAQYFGVAQRRRRVFVVGYAGNWRPAAAVLFERQSLCRDTKPSRETGQEVARDFGTGVARMRGFGDYACDGTASAIKARDYKDATDLVTTVYENHPTDSRIKPLDKTCSTVTARWGTGGGNTPIVAQPMAFGWQNSPSQGDSVSTCVTPTLDKSKTPAVAVDVYNQTIDGEVAATLTEACGGTNTNGSKVLQPIPYDLAQVTSPHNRQSRKEGDPCHTLLRQSAHNAGIVFSDDLKGGTQTISETSGTLRANLGSGFRSDGSPVEGVAIQGMAVRRLTPIECERLQGFPDGYTQIEWRNKPADQCPDSHRYKALGNSMAVPVMRWIGQRIDAVSKLAVSHD